MQLSSRILTALAVLILAVAVVAVRAGSSGTVEAATGTIDVLNVGTCYTTSTDIFGVGDCNDGDPEDNNLDTTDDSGYNVAGRDTITKTDSVFATYAIDPKTSGDQPRVIAENADLIKISIEDEGRDRRTGVLFAVGDTVGGDLSVVLAPPDTAVPTKTYKNVVDEELGTKLVGQLQVDATTGLTAVNSAAGAFFQGGNTIADSGDHEFRLDGDLSTNYPMADEDERGKFYWFGQVRPNGTSTDTAFINLEDYIELDEDLSSGVSGSIAPWMRVTASVPADQDIFVQYIYYQTSNEEEIVGGLKKANYIGYTDTADPTNSVTAEPALNGLAPVFVDDEDKAIPINQDALVLSASGDGVPPAQNLWLKENGRFSGRYEGYLRLTDADGDGTCDDDDDPNTPDTRCNWGREAGPAASSAMADAAVLGVESGPISITYKNSVGDTRSITILIDKDPPAIQIDSPVHGAASKDDSPDLIGSFTDGGGSGLRDESFKVYADNRNHGDKAIDAEPVWDLGVHDSTAPITDPGFVCINADGDLTCDPATSQAVLRADYFGYNNYSTFGIVSSKDVYLPEEDPSDPTVDLFKTADAEPYEDGAANGTFDTVVRIDFTPDKADDNRYNDQIDIQAVVMDIAGNIGFSDSQPSDPTFIHDFGTKSADRDDLGTHNVIGWYSRHIYYLDDVDPKYVADESATGFFLGTDDKPMRTSSGLMVVFDGDIDASTVGIGTFDVQLDGGSNGTVIDAKVKNEKVYLQLEETLAPDATPKVDLAAGQAISDRAGNESTDRRLDGIELSDGILPTFTVTLSGGTGLNEDIDGEGPSELTKGQMKISVSANEAIQGSPKFAVVCSNLFWDDNVEDNNVGKFASNRTGHFTSTKINDADPDAAHTDPAPILNAAGNDTRTLCDDAAAPDYLDVAVTSALARPGNNWEYQWSNLSGDQMVNNGKLSVIVWGRDRSSFKDGAETLYNYSASPANFVYDTDLKAAWESADGLVPAKDENVFEVRPFVLLDFGDEGTTVDVTTFTVDGTDFTADLMGIEDNEFVWWPEPLAYGTYDVYVEANDAANNQDDYTYSFSVKERAPFVLNLLAGWNSISFPSNPVDRALHAVFTDPAIDQVIGWDVTEPVSPWRMATRVDGVWTTSEEVATLNDVEARYGYWVHSQGFITQAVKLAGKGDRATDGQPNPANIPTDEGWNFVGVVDVDGDQTQDDAGETLRSSDNDPITAANYLGNYTRAYTWDHINNTWDVLKKDEDIVIGTGIWVYYTKGHNIAP